MAVFGYVEREGGEGELGSWNLEAVRGACWRGGSVALLVSYRVVLYFVAWGRGIKRYRSRALCLISIILQIHIAQSISPLLLSCTLPSSSSHPSYSVSYSPAQLTLPQPRTPQSTPTRHLQHRRHNACQRCLLHHHHHQAQARGLRRVMRLLRVR
jgi:hypothetical protein